MQDIQSSTRYIFFHFFAKRRKSVEKINNRKKNRGHRTSKIVKSTQSYKQWPFVLLLFTLLLSARARCMTWRVNFVRSKDAQKQLARTSLRNAKCREPAFHLLVTVQQTIVEKYLERPFIDMEDLINDAFITWYCTSSCASRTGKVLYYFLLNYVILGLTNSSLGVKSYCYPVHDVTVFR